MLIVLFIVQLKRNRWGVVNYLPERAPLQKKVTQHVRPYVWYLVATLCDAKKEVPLDYKVTFLNSDNSHFSFHETPYPVLYTVLFVFCFAALLYVGFVCWQRMAKSTLMHRSALQLMAALALQALAFFLETLHLTWYSYDGVGSPACDLLSDVSGKLSQFMVAWTLLDLTWGWFHTTIAQEWKQTAAIGAMFAVFLTYLAIPVLTRSSFGSAGVRVSHHEHDSWMGFLLMILKAVLCLAFGYGCMKTYRSEPSAQQQKFLQVFAVLGSAWFLAFPVIVVIAELVPPYYQHMASTIGVVLCQMIGLTFLCVLLLSNTDYYRLMTSADVLLPTSNKRL